MRGLALIGLAIALGTIGVGTIGSARVAASAEVDVVKTVTIRAPRDMGYFAGDLVNATVDIVVDDGYEIEQSSLPRPGPVNYWLDLRGIGFAEHGAPDATRHYTLNILYQNFYNALDVRSQEIPTFPVTFRKGSDSVSANVPAWTIGVSPLREVAPLPKSDPKDYLRADESAPSIRSNGWWWGAGAAAVAAVLALALLAHDRAWWPFHARPVRVFTQAVRRLRTLAKRPDSAGSYLEALLVVHRGIDETDGQRVLADDMPLFLDRHPIFAPLRDGFRRFFTASRYAFFGSDPHKARGEFDFGTLQSFVRQLAAIERVRP